MDAREPATPAIRTGRATIRSTWPVTDEQHPRRPDRVPGGYPGSYPGTESGLGQQPQPGLPAERAEPVRLPHYPHPPVGLAQRELILGQDPVVGGIRIRGALPEARLPTAFLAAAARPGAGAECLCRVVRGE